MAFLFPEDKADFLAPNGVMYSWDGDKWRTKSFKVDVEGDSGLMASVQRVEDNLDLVQDTVGAGEYTRVGKPDLPGTLEEGQACFLQDGGDEATTFAEVENILLNKKGKGPYANFDDAKKGDYLLIQSTVDGDFGLYVIRNATSLDAFWDFGLEISSGKAVGTVPEIGEGIVVRTSRPTFTVAQDVPPDFSSTGQLWFDTNAHTLKVWDEEAQVFVETGGDGSDVHVGEDAPADPSEGDLWYDSTRLELFVFYTDPDDVGGWVPCSPLGARVEAGEIVQQQLVERVGELEKRDPGDYLAKGASNDVTTSFRIKSGNNTLISTSGNNLGLYNLSAPTNPSHAVNLGYLETNFLSLEDGGTIKDLTIVDRPSGTAFKIKKAGVDCVKIEAGGKIFCKYNLDLDDDPTTVVTRGWVKDYFGENAGGGGGPTTKYDGNRYCKIGLSTTTLETGDVMFLNDQLVSEATPSKIAAIALPIDEFDWDKCAKSGIIKANNGGTNAGYYQVYALKEMSGRNMIVYVKPLVVDDSVRHEEGGAPCYFQGVFFG